MTQLDRRRLRASKKSSSDGKTTSASKQTNNEMDELAAVVPIPAKRDVTSRTKKNRSNMTVSVTIKFQGKRLKSSTLSSAVKASMDSSNDESVTTSRDSKNISDEDDEEFYDSASYSDDDEEYNDSDKDNSAHKKRKRKSKDENSLKKDDSTSTSNRNHSVTDAIPMVAKPWAIKKEAKKKAMDASKVPKNVIDVDKIEKSSTNIPKKKRNDPSTVTIQRKGNKNAKTTTSLLMNMELPPSKITPSTNSTPGTDTKSNFNSMDTDKNIHNTNNESSNFNRKSPNNFTEEQSFKTDNNNNNKSSSSVRSITPPLPNTTMSKDDALKISSSSQPLRSSSTSSEQKKQQLLLNQKMYHNLEKLIQQVLLVNKDKNLDPKNETNSITATLHRSMNDKRDRSYSNNSTNNDNHQTIDLNGSFLDKEDEDDRYDFFDRQPNCDDFQSDVIVLQERIPIFPEDFKNPNKQKEWPLSWWGIIEPPPSIVSIHNHNRQKNRNNNYTPPPPSYNPHPNSIPPSSGHVNTFPRPNNNYGYSPWSNHTSNNIRQRSNKHINEPPPNKGYNTGPSYSSSDRPSSSGDQMNRRGLVRTDPKRR